MYLKATNALDDKADTFSHTRMGRGHWWRGHFTEKHVWGYDSGAIGVKSVKILNRKDCCGDRLRNTEVRVGRYSCGKLPAKTETGKWYEVKCVDKNGKETTVHGNQVTIRQNTTYTALQLAKVEVYYDDNCTHNERKNSRGPHKCWSSGECTGARACSRWGWCHGTTQCPKPKDPPKPKATYALKVEAKDKACAKTSLADELGAATSPFTTAEACAATAMDNGCAYM